MSRHYKYRRFIYDFINGIRSNIPVCCTIMFSVERFKGQRNIAMHKFLKRNPDKTTGHFGFTDLNCSYVQCNKCYSENIVNELKLNGSILKILVKNNKPWTQNYFNKTIK